MSFDLPDDLLTPIHHMTKPVTLDAVELDRFRGVTLLQRGQEDLIAVASGTTGTDPDTDYRLDTRFQISSISKQFTATALLLLADRGVLSVEDPVHRWIDGCPSSWDSMTVHHLLTHTAGLGHWWHIPELDLTKPMAADEELRLFQESPLLSPPGDSYSYSSPGYVVIARIVERAAGQPYASFLTREMFEPLAMTATFAGNGTCEYGLAVGHNFGAAVTSFELDTVGMGAGDIWSVAGDMARWDRALASGEILSHESRQAMLKIHAAVEDDDGLVRTRGYGYGWYIGSVTGGHPVIYHTGDNVGFLSFNAWFPEDAVRLIVLTNEETTDLQAIIGQVVMTAFP
jgi:CubicO group peptidase (beta-lactamase class C family)